MNKTAVLTAADLAGMSGAECLGDSSVVFNRAWADSRRCGENDLFVALPGERVDGHDYIASAWEHGASVVLADRSKIDPGIPQGKALLLADNALVALQQAAKAWRDSMTDLGVVGITGSNGKTTTKELLVAILQEWRHDEVFFTPGNYNSDIGLPLATLSLRASHRLAVFEMGMNKPGEIALLADIVRPDVAVVTNVGVAHIGLLGSREAIAKEKRDIFSTADSRSVAVVPRDDDWRDFLVEDFPGRVVEFALDDAGEGVDLEALPFALPGRHNRLNAQAAVAAALAVGTPRSAIEAGLRKARPVGGRSEFLEGRYSVIRDCYNANPDSLAAALELFQETPGTGRRVLVLGELLELGGEMERALREAGGAVFSMGVDAIFLFGSSLGTLEEELKGLGYDGLLTRFVDFGSLKDAVATYVLPGDLILVKGSRGSALERLDSLWLEGGTE